MASEAFSTAQVSITSPFWSQYQDRVRNNVIPTIIETQKALDHWCALTWKEGHEPKPHPFWDSDVYKCFEAACYSLMKQEDVKLRTVVEETVDMIRMAQHSDGYINSFHTVAGLQHRWTNLRDLHELYCLGHFLEAAVAYEELTGSGRLLGVATRAIDHVASTFGRGPSQKPGYCGHQEIELALLKFYEFTKYLPAFDLAKYFITERGRRDVKGETYYDHEAFARGADPYDDQGTEHKAWYHGCRDYAYHQSDCLLTEAKEVKGHSVRAMYYYTAATDLVRLSREDDEEILAVKASLERLWRDMVDGKMYITGGIGSVTKNEGFGKKYVLGDLEVEGCYAETCAAFGLIVWCQRLLRLKLDVEYSDIMEQTLYNGFLGAMSADGKGFYYQNVLRTLGGDPKDRSSWFGCACCPPNVAKLLCSLGSLIYTTDVENTFVAIHMYIGSRLEIPGTNTVITLESDLPWGGTVSIKIQGSVSVALRIPDWASDYTCSVGGVLRDGYLYLPQTADAEVQLEFSMKPRKIFANPLTNKDEVCLMRGPLVYCIEDVDNSGIDTDRISLTEAPVNDGPSINILDVKKVVTLTTKCQELRPASFTHLYGTEPWRYQDVDKTVVAIPYFLRANRAGNGAMRVWTRWMRQANVPQMNELRTQ